MRATQWPFYVLSLLLLTPAMAHGAVTITVEQELTHGGNNYDDPCFWQDPSNPSHSFACITSKDDDHVECFSMPSGSFVGTADGFSGAANNCEVDAARNELVTTDNGGDRVLVHRLPDLGNPIRVLEDSDFSDVTGVCVGHSDGRSLVFVTDEAENKVFALDSLSGQRITSFSHGLAKAEGIACDDRQQRVYVCDDEVDEHSCRAFTFNGQFVAPEFGIPQTSTDSEGVTVYECGPSDGYIIVSDQKKDEFEVFDRTVPFTHRCTFELEVGGDLTNDTDGIDVVQIPAYPNGIFGACDGCSGSSDELDLVRWERIAEACGLKVCPLGELPNGQPALCGDGQVNQITEVCDGDDDFACPGRCRIDCTCDPAATPTPGGEPAPGCGDGIAEAGEECDGPDDALCPGYCLADCTCGVAADDTLVTVVADASTRERSPNKNINRKKLTLDRKSAKLSFLRIRVEGVGTGTVGAAYLHLTVSNSRRAKSNHGGKIYETACDWSEDEITWDTQPSMGRLIDEHASRVSRTDIVTFDLTGSLTGDGDHCYGLASPSSNSVQYDSRESSTGPVVELVVGGGGGGGGAPSSRCGDGMVNQVAEQCDGSDDAACPGQCGADCRCPTPVASADGDTFACLASGADVVIDGTHTSDYYTRDLPRGTVIDARNATFVHCSQPESSNPCDENIYPVNLGPPSGSDGCWAGGLVMGANRLDASWDEMHSPNNAGFIFENANFTVDGLRMHNVGDGIRPRSGADGFVIRNVWLSYVRDDCIENDNMSSGLVDDSLFDGCYVGFSARHSNTSVEGRDKVWTIQNSLVRLEAMPGPREGGDLGHKTFFKWNSWGDPDSRSPKLALYNNVFMAEEVGQTSEKKMGIPPGKLVDCANNTMVWLGPGDYPAELPSCFTVVKDASVWEAAKADWIARHPELRRP